MTQLFNDNFETENFNAWSGVSGSPTVDNSNPYSGTYNLHVSGASFASGDIVAAYKTGLDTGDHVNVRVRNLKFSTAGTATNLCLIALDDNISTCLARAGVLYSSGNWHWGFRYYDATAGIINATSTVVATPGTNYDVEFEFQRDDSGDDTGYLNLYLNGSLVYSLSGISFISNRSPNYVIVGLAYCQGGINAQTDIYVDDTEVADTYIGIGGTDLTVAGNLTVNGNTSVGGSLQVATSPTFPGLTISGNAGVTNLNVASGLTLNGNSGNSGQVLRSNGSGNAPSWQTVSGGTGFITSIAPGQPLSAPDGVLSLNVSSPLQISGSSLGINTGASPTFAGLTITGAISNRGNYYYTVDRDGSTLIEAIGVEGTYPNTDFHFLPDFQTKTGGTSKVYFGYNSDWGSYNWMNGSTNLMSLNSSGALTITGGIIAGSGSNFKRNADYVTISNRLLPTESYQYKTYTDLGHGNILFEHTGSPDANHRFPPIDGGIHWGRYANIYMIMLQDNTQPNSINYQPMIAMDRGLWVEKDIQAYGALMTNSDPVKGTGGGAVVIGHGFYGSASYPPCIWLSDSSFDTLHIYSNVENQTHGHLALSCLTTDGIVTIGTLANTTYRGPLYSTVGGIIGYNQSTIRVKRNVQDLPDCSWIYNLRPVTFDWIDQMRAKADGSQIGLIAEEVNEQCPQIVFLDNEGKPEGVHYEWLGIPLLVEVKKLRQRVETLENQLKNQTET